MKRIGTVDEYISNAPEELQDRLKEIRKAIKEVCPDAAEGISYRMPYYSYKGRLAWFAFMKTHIGLYLRPPIIDEHRLDLKNYEFTKSAIRFPLNERLPIKLIKRLVRERMSRNEVESRQA